MVPSANRNKALQYCSGQSGGGGDSVIQSTDKEKYLQERLFLIVSLFVPSYV